MTTCKETVPARMVRRGRDLKRTSVFLSLEQVERLEAEAERHQSSLSGVIRKAVMEHLERSEGNG